MGGRQDLTVYCPLLFCTAAQGVVVFNGFKIQEAVRGCDSRMTVSSREYYPGCPIGAKSEEVLVGVQGMCNFIS